MKNQTNQIISSILNEYYGYSNTQSLEDAILERAVECVVEDVPYHIDEEESGIEYLNSLNPEKIVDLISRDYHLEKILKNYIAENLSTIIEEAGKQL